MKISVPEITQVEIINNEIIVTFTPALEYGSEFSIVENRPGTPGAAMIGVVYDSSNKVKIPFSNLSPEPILEYYISYVTTTELIDEKITNENFLSAVNQKTMLYNLETINSSARNLSGKSSPGAIIEIRSMNYNAPSDEVVSRALTDINGNFTLKFSNTLGPYRPYQIKANGRYFSPQQDIVIQKSPDDKELIFNGSFQDGLNYWSQHPVLKEFIVFTQKDGYGNFTLTDEGVGENRVIEAVQNILGPTSSNFKLSCDVRVNRIFETGYSATFLLGEIIVAAGPGKTQRYEFNEQNLGQWITVTFDWQFSTVKYGFTTNGIADMDIRNVSMIEI